MERRRSKMANRLTIRHPEPSPQPPQAKIDDHRMPARIFPDFSFGDPYDCYCICYSAFRDFSEIISTIEAIPPSQTFYVQNPLQLISCTVRTDTDQYGT